MSARPGLSRRRFLRGAGSAALALPLLDYFQPRRALAAACKMPRLLVYYFPNGRRPEWWVPSAGAGGLTFRAQAAALQPFAGRALSLVNLDNVAARTSPGAAHAMGTSTIMTGTTIPDLVGLKNNVSLDQVIAQNLPTDTRFRSLQWSAGEPGTCDVGGSSCAYTQSISWAGYGQPLIPTIDPAIAFDRLFRSGTDGMTGGAGAIRKRSLTSVIDRVKEDADDLSGKLGGRDRQRLDEYLTALREVERSLTAAEAATCEVPSVGPGGGLSYPARVAAFQQLIKLAFQCDQTRIMTFMIEFGLSGRSHDFINAGGGHHALSHYGSTAQYQALERLETWHSQQLGAMLQILADTPGTEAASLLDETLVLAIGSMGAGSNHDHANNCPLLFGGGGIVNATGRQIVASGTPLANLHVTLLKAFGVEGTFGNGGAIFGDYGTAEIPGIIGTC